MCVCVRGRGERVRGEVREEEREEVREEVREGARRDVPKSMLLCMIER